MGRAVSLAAKGEPEAAPAPYQPQPCCAEQLAHVCAQSCPTLQPCGLRSTRLLCPWESPGKNTGVGCHFLLQGIFMTQGLNLHLQH